MTPTAADKAPTTAEINSTREKLLVNFIAQSAGKRARADISSEPDSFIPTTITSAQTTAIAVSYTPVFVPVALANLSSKVTESSLYLKITASAAKISVMASTNITSRVSTDKIAEEPKSAVQTSPLIFASPPPRESTVYPIAKAPTETTAMTASPEARFSGESLSMNIAAITVTGKTS